MDKDYNTSTKWRVYASWVVMTLPKIQCIDAQFSVQNNYTENLYMMLLFHLNPSHLDKIPVLFVNL